MLILKRREGQSLVVIDRDTDEILLTIWLTNVPHDSQVQIGIDAPDQGIRILRGELHRQIEAGRR